MWHKGHQPTDAYLSSRTKCQYEYDAGLASVQYYSSYREEQILASYSPCNEEDQPQIGVHIIVMITKQERTRTNVIEWWFYERRCTEEGAFGV
jgi:hypothetical protein